MHPQSGMGTVWIVGPTRAPVAQLDRASDFGSEGCRFKSCPVHHGFYWGFCDTLDGQYHGDGPLGDRSLPRRSSGYIQGSCHKLSLTHALPRSSGYTAGFLPQTQPDPGTSEIGRFLRKRHSAEHDREAAFSMAGTLDGQAIFMASTTGTDRSEIGPYLGYLLAAIGNAFRLQPPMVHPL